jgi:hypothetical protein
MRSMDDKIMLEIVGESGEPGEGCFGFIAQEGRAGRPDRHGRRAG